HFVPSMLQLFLEEPSLAGGLAPRVPRLIVASGEALPPELVRRCRERLPESRLENLYGPTEAAVDVTAWSCGVADRRAVPIGRPIANAGIHLLGGDLQPVPLGAPGELHIGGANVGRGYLDRPALTAERFVPDPWASWPGGRLYRTGDLARRLPGGEVEFLGRLDHQVKVRGFRVELGEIETVLAEHPEVREAVVVARGAAGETGLVAYVVPVDGVVPTTLALQEFLGRRLPGHMVPGLFAALEALPLSPNGKVDRRALPDPVAGRLAAGTPFVPPEGAVEIELASLWSEALGVAVAGIGRHDSFFSLGGHSLLATRLLSRYRAAFGVELPLRRLFEAPTLGGLARTIEEARATAPAPPRPDPPALRRMAREGFRVNPKSLDHARARNHS
ncbi:MAG TPA: non-ribosomal peptide synthetase, partial [Thermoanaerobaculia bacterium]|nr:non-ribosomal peptide synthetase [Thermoanaerobaculia bacterium]